MSELQALRQMLRKARCRVARRRILCKLATAADLALIVLVVAAGAVVLSALAGTALASLAWRLAAAGAMAILILLAAVVRGWWEMPSDAAAAQRLDLSAQLENRVATALELAAAGEGSSFARAAVGDGLRALRSHAAESPAIDPVQWNTRRKGVLAGAAVVLATLALLMAMLPGRGGVGPGPLLPLANQQAAVNGARPTTSRPVPATQQAQRPSPADATTAPPGSAAASAQRGMGEASSGRQSGAAAASGMASATSGGAGSPLAGKAASAGRTGNPPRRPASPQPAESRQQPATETPAGASTIAGGAAGGGRSMKVENTWQQRDLTDGHNADELQGDVPEADANSENAHRGTVQPVLQDRNASPTRELGISSSKGAGGTGRGGPTPPKKARGTGSLLLAAPLPDFIPGQLLPGASKVIHESTRPRPLRREAPPAADAAARTTDESVLPRFDVPPELTESAWRYYQSLRSAMEKRDEAP